MLLSENIDRLMKKLKLNNSQLSKEIGISDENIRKWRKGETLPSIPNAILLADYFNISLDELSGRKPLHTEQTIDLPLVGAVNAGSFIIENEEEWEGEYKSINTIQLKGRNPKECVLLKVSGDSMEPDIYQGETIVVHLQNTAANGQIVVAYDENEGGYTLKKFTQYRDEVRLVPSNPSYKEYIYDNPSWQQLKIWGICISNLRFYV